MKEETADDLRKKIDSMEGQCLPIGDLSLFLWDIRHSPVDGRTMEDDIKFIVDKANPIDPGSLSSFEFINGYDKLLGEMEKWKKVASQNKEEAGDQAISTDEKAGDRAISTDEKYMNLSALQKKKQNEEKESAGSKSSTSPATSSPGLRSLRKQKMQSVRYTPGTFTKPKDSAGGKDTTDNDQSAKADPIDTNGEIRVVKSGAKSFSQKEQQGLFNVKDQLEKAIKSSSISQKAGDKYHPVPPTPPKYGKQSSPQRHVRFAVDPESSDSSSFEELRRRLTKLEEMQELSPSTSLGPPSSSLENSHYFEELQKANQRIEKEMNARVLLRQYCRDLEVELQQAKGTSNKSLLGQLIPSNGLHFSVFLVVWIISVAWFSYCLIVKNTA